MNVVAERFIELSVLQRHRKLTLFEANDLKICLKYLEKLEWQKANLKELSYLASLTNDTEWQFEICSRLENLS